MNAMAEKVADIEQKAARARGRDGEAPKTWGEQFVEAESVKQFLDAGGPRTGKADLQMKATLTSAITNAAGSVGDAIDSARGCRASCRWRSAG